MLLMFFACSVGCLGPVERVYPPVSSVGTESPTIFVTSNGWHTSLVLRNEDLPASLRSKLKNFDAFPWLEIGWGEEAFYRAPEVTAGLLVKAALASDGSVMHVRGLTVEPLSHYVEYDVSVYRVRLSDEGLRRLAHHVESSIIVNDQGAAADAGAGQDLDSRFIHASGRYSVLHTCNHWTADALRAGGLPITPVYCGAADNVEFQLRQRLERYQGDPLVMRSGR
jgi:uncharacterized protein (TIGR02117 family)